MGYVKQGFKDGDVLDASQLVKIEQGIQDNEKETAKKAERVVFLMEATGGGNGVYSLEFVDGKTRSDVSAAILAKKEVIVQINGNSVYMNGVTLFLPYAGVAKNGAFGFTYSATDGDKMMIISVALGERYSMLVEMNPITSVDGDTFWTQENRDSLATILENVPIVADNADAASSTNAIRNSFISALRGGVTPAEPVLVSISVTPTSITVPSGTTASKVKDYLTNMTGHYETAGVSGQTTKDLTSELSSATISGTMPTPGNTSTMTISYGGKSTTVSVTMKKATPTLTGLTATYTGGTVAAGTTLSQLTEVVKATYSDGTTSAALTKGTDYTLSGTLTAGQANTVTVTGKGTYAGHTTTFSVTVDAPITLSRLKVTYDNGTAVAAGTTLAQLNEVVRAVYSDNSESDVLVENTDYTLSGTLTPGQTNTVTVTGKGTYAGLTAVTFEVTVKAAASTTHAISYDSTVDGAQTVTFTPMPTEVNDGASTTISMSAKVPTASYYEGATGIAINEVRKSSVKVGTTKTEGTGTLTVSNQKADAVVTGVPTLFFYSTNQAYTDGTTYAPKFSSYVSTCVSGLYELKAGKHYIYTDGGSGKKFRVAFVRANYTAMGGSIEQVSGTTIKLGGANSDLAVPTDAKYFFLRYSAIDKSQTVVQTALANAYILLECE